MNKIVKLHNDLTMCERQIKELQNRRVELIAEIVWQERSIGLIPTAENKKLNKPKEKKWFRMNEIKQFRKKG